LNTGRNSGRTNNQRHLVKLHCHSLQSDSANSDNMIDRLIARNDIDYVEATVGKNEAILYFT
jgi:hypothetical protein